MSSLLCIVLPPLCFDLSALLRSLALLADLGKTPLVRNCMLLYLNHALPDHVCAEGFLPVSSGDPSCVLLGGCTETFLFLRGTVEFR